VIPISKDLCTLGECFCIRKILYIKIVFLIFNLLTPSFGVAANKLNIAVIYPKSERVSKLFDTIIDGMQKHHDINLYSMAINKETDTSDIKKWIDQYECNAIVALGKQGSQFSRYLDLGVPLITGAHIIAQPNQATVSLAADPRQLFNKLKELKQNVKRIFVVYNQSNTGWLMQQATRAADELQLDLIKLSVNNTRQVTVAFDNILQQANPGEDAVWLPLDPVIPTKVVFPILLKFAWNNNLTVFSNNPMDVKKGALFAMYPDYFAMGRQLVELTLARINQNGLAAPEASQFLKIAVNRRTALHLGIKLSRINALNFNLLYP